MADTIIFKELNGLPSELEAWGQQALSKIESPEKKHEAAKILRQNIDQLWNDCSLENTEEKMNDVLTKLGDAYVVAEEMKESYALKRNPRTDRIAGIIALILAALCAIYPLMAFFLFPNENVSEGSIFIGYISGRGAGVGLAGALFLLVIGLWLLWYSKKKE